jgi:hypothetical protein
MDMSKTDVGLSNSLTDLAARINEAHHLAMHHAGRPAAEPVPPRWEVLGGCYLFPPFARARTPIS